MTERSSPVAADRPIYHFTAPRNWLNDPNGLVYVDGKYHLFYQHNPFESRFGPPHWGHATSRDLLSWEHHPIVLEPDDLGWIFSGSAVIDIDNTAGFGAGAIVAVFTHHLEPGIERQSIAYSTDGGRTFDKYEGNPVLEPPDGEADFRDPRVFWWGSSRGGHWVMLLVVGVAVWVYTSDDLIHWDPASRFDPDPRSALVWECPDLMRVPVAGTTAHRWLMTVGVDSGDLSQSYGTRYWVGDFDGYEFTQDHTAPHWADYGADFYAAQSWTAAPDGRNIWIAWMNNWRDAGQDRAEVWRGAMTVPRDVGIVATSEGLRLTQQPVREVEDRRKPLLNAGGIDVTGDCDLLAAVRGVTLDLVLNVGLERSTARQLRLAVRVGEDESTDITLGLRDGSLAVDCFHRGRHMVHRDYMGPRLMSVVHRDGVLDLRVLIDTTSVEVFAGGGLVSITQQIFPDRGSTGVRLEAVDGVAVVESLAVYEIGPGERNPP